jgi:hypothetical protein
MNFFHVEVNQDDLTLIIDPDLGELELSEIKGYLWTMQQRLPLWLAEVDRQIQLRKLRTPDTIAVEISEPRLLTDGKEEQ